MNLAVGVRDSLKINCVTNCVTQIHNQDINASTPLHPSTWACFNMLEGSGLSPAEQIELQYARSQGLKPPLFVQASVQWLLLFNA